MLNNASIFPQYERAKGLFIFLLLVVVIFGPWMLLGGLAFDKRRKTLYTELHRARFGNLYENYRENRYGWVSVRECWLRLLRLSCDFPQEFVILTRRVTLIAITVGVSANIPQMLAWLSFTNVLIFGSHMAAWYTALRFHVESRVESVESLVGAGRIARNWTTSSNPCRC